MAFDYAYVRRDDDEEVATLLVMRDRNTRAVRAWVLEHKGVDLSLLPTSDPTRLR